MSDHHPDLEKQTLPQQDKALDNESASSSSAPDPAVIRASHDLKNTRADRIGEIQRGNAVLRALAAFEKRLDNLNGFEAQGVERVPEDQRKPPQILNVN